jgi:flagellar basal body-associated protein FliL
MLTIVMLTIILPIIALGAIVGAYYAIDHQGRADTRAKEMRDIDAWLEQIRKITR